MWTRCELGWMTMRASHDYGSLHQYSYFVGHLQPVKIIWLFWGKIKHLFCVSYEMAIFSSTDLSSGPVFCLHWRVIWQFSLFSCWVLALKCLLFFSRAQVLSLRQEEFQRNFRKNFPQPIPPNAWNDESNVWHANHGKKFWIILVQV